MISASIASAVASQGLPYFASNLKCRDGSVVKVRCSDGGSLGVVPPDSSVVVNGAPAAVGGVGRVEKLSGEGGNWKLGLAVDGEKVSEGNFKASEKLDALWDDGSGTASVRDYLDVAKDMIKPDGGPPRWFCPVECGRPLGGSPLLLFLPGMDGVGISLLLHHKALGKVFEVWCMHIPIFDRTPFTGLVKFVEETVRAEHAACPDKPIYLVGDSFGGCLALAIAARNPSIDMVLILTNPATSYGRSQLQPLLPVLEAFPDELHFMIPYLLSFVMGDPVKMAMANIQSRFPPAQVFKQLSGNLVDLLPRISVLSDVIPKGTLIWKLKLLESAAAYANSRLHAVKAEVLVLASGRDNMVPSKDEGIRLSQSLQNCIVRNFKDNGHTLLLEDGFDLLSVIKGTTKYRRSKSHDFVKDFIPPSITDYKRACENVRLLTMAASPVIFSTLEDGKIVKGLLGVPNEGPVLLVGYHMLMGFELAPIIQAFLEEKNIMVRGLAHPQLFLNRQESIFTDSSYFDTVKLFGATPVTPGNFFKLLSSKSHVLLYPGGAREALHPKGEEYKLIWPDQPEFVRMAARFGATIVPFGTVGEDDLIQLVFDFDDLMKIPIISNYYRRLNEDAVRARENEAMFMPGMLPKFPGRFYYLFGKPIKTEGRETMLNDKCHANVLYLQIKSEVERLITYLKNKREEDPYRGIIERTVYQATLAPSNQIPSFDP